MKGKRIKKKKSKRLKIVIKILRIILIIIIIYSGIKIIKWCLNNSQNRKILNENKDLVEVQLQQNGEKKYVIDFKTLKERNSDCIAWLKVPNTNIDFPVVKEKNNDYYLTHNFNKEYNIAGWIFADYKNNFDETDKNIVIYGHNMKDNSMFATLKNILKKEWYNNEENKYVSLYTENEYERYEIFSVYKIKAEEYYIKTDMNDNEFLQFKQTLKNRSIKEFDVDVSKIDKILTLSTCANNNQYRVVLHAGKV